nr:Chain C, CP5-46-A PEPTIDE [synthetic construct]4A1T_D Chain D, CP5-46-A PEPTIDE [synthetic construct]4A1X_C Chain C, CP5-46-A PEPTIDE [synthetic construct]4A1X_D Chain D, CP5-46-A PEPTIDE [synthetic construct]
GELGRLVYLLDGPGYDPIHCD